MNPIIIGLYGEQGVGKSTLAAQLCPLGFCVEPFAKVIKEMAAPLEQYMNPVPKNEQCPRLGFSSRRLQQLLGTEVGRALNPELWIKIMELRIQHMPRVVIDDVRFDNERDWIRERNGILIHVESNDFGMDQANEHASEKDWHQWEPDFVWYNDKRAYAEENAFLKYIVDEYHQRSIP